MKRCCIWAVSTLAIVVGLSVRTAATFAGARLQSLGDLADGGTDSRAIGVSANGAVVVGESQSASGTEAFRWSEGEMSGLGGLSASSTFSRAYGVSGDGSIAIGVSDSAAGIEAFRWTSDGGMVGLGDLPGGSRYSGANGISADGSVIVGYGTGATGRFEAFRWTADSGMVGLGYLATDVQSLAYATNSDGSVVVGMGNYEAFRWTSDGGMIGLGILPGGINGSAAMGVSGDGSVVVGNGFDFNGIHPEAFRWTEGTGMIGLGDLPGGPLYSIAYGANRDGSVVVGIGTSDLGSEAFRWSSDGGMQSIWNHLLANGVDPADSGWTSLFLASSVSLDGNTTVGFGVRNGNVEAFRAVVPEPEGLALLGVGSLALLFRARRSVS
jgi:probable HAF family extracellular repeat protein